MSADSDSALDLAARRLERALTLLEQRTAERLARAGAEGGGLFDQDRANLASALDAARAREKALEAAGAEASAALGRAIAEIRAALDRDEAAHGPAPTPKAENDATPQAASAGN